ncbi:hypothetical protein D3OALGB2SA_3026 [Olavius algarvensis associated proteobacterium Delta 3]|nr:hypothetical protein D3OALGB2SA_3026 [Olavius algarvensis associated proteobacterium Delta 3]
MQQETVWPTSMGDVTILRHCSVECIREYAFGDQFGSYAQYKSLYTHRDSLEDIASRKDTSVTLAVNDHTQIVGLGLLSPPEPDERWAGLGSGVMTEVKAVEVSRRWRKGRLARGILTALLFDPDIEERIIYMVGYSWTWDLDGSGLSAQEYRNMLIRLFTAFKFQELQTNEPNVCLKPENLFMGRIGSAVSEEIQKSFKWLRFGVAP